MSVRTYRLSAKLWRWQGDSAWYFLYVDKATSAVIRAGEKQRPRRGFGSVRVRARVGATSWHTSIFPTKEGVYLLPVKSPVRTAEELCDGDVVHFSITPHAR